MTSGLIALADGDLAFQPISDRAGVYAEPALLAQAVREFEDVERMMQATEGLYGPYRWGRYDILALPPASSIRWVSCRWCGAPVGHLDRASGLDYN